MLIEGKAGSLGELIAEVQRISQVFKPNYQDPEEIWYRGQSKASHMLLPNLYRPEIARFNYDEVSLMHRFRQLATPFLEPIPIDEWEWYFLARHHGLPSRLLDWSESLLTAVFFALENHLPKNRLEFDDTVSKAAPPPVYEVSSPVVWMMDAGSLNKASVNDDAVLVPGVDGGEHKLTPAYLPSKLDMLTDNELPLAILPMRANRRIVAQQGMFTVHGRQKRAIEEIAIGTDLRLARIVLDRSRIAHLWCELQLTGTNRLTLFPDVDSVVSKICWEYQSAI